MSKFCTKCGNELNDDALFCTKCGAKFEESTTANETVNNNQSTQQATFASAPLLEKRDIALTIILSIVTCGIYGLYWFVKMTDEANRISGEDGTSGGMALLFGILTCGIYYFYWNYKMGQKLVTAGKTHGKNIEDNSVLYLVLSLFGLSIVSYALIQNDLNKFAE